MSKTLDIDLRKYLRLALLVTAIVMLCYQSLTAFKLIMDPPMIVTTSEDDIKNVPAPLLYLCPNGQYNHSILKENGYLTEYHFIQGNHTDDHMVGTWGTAANQTWGNLVGDLLSLSPGKLLETLNKPTNSLELKTHLYPKFGYCFEVCITSMEETLVFDFSSKDNELNKGITVMISDPKTKSYIQIDPNSHQGEVLQIEKQASYSYYVDLEIHQLSKSSNCNPDPEYSYFTCVDDYITNDFMPVLGCIPPLLSNHDHCVENKSNITNYISNYAQKYLSNVATMAETSCQKPCRQLKMKVTLKDQTYSPTKYGVFNFNPKVKVLTEQPNYDWFNFIIDIGSSLGTWAGLSAISLIDFALYPVTSFKSFVKGN